MVSNENAVIAFARDERGNSKHIFHDERILYSYGRHFVLAVKLNGGEYLINGDTYSSSTSRHTSLCIMYLTPNVIIPFSALNQVTRDYQTIEIVDRSSDIYIPRTRRDPKTGKLIEYQEHRLGSAVIKIEDKYYLSSIDAGAKGQGGYFLVELPEPAKTVDEAFDVIFPATLKKDVPYVRQGEFFFVPTDIKTYELLPVEPQYEWRYYDYVTQRIFRRRFETKEAAEKYLPKYLDENLYETPNSVVVHKMPIKDPNNLARYFKNAGTGNAHMVTEIRKYPKTDMFFARGTVSHPEHRRLNLGKIWHMVYVNRAVRSFSAGGNVD